MELFKGLFGGVIGHIDPVEVAKGIFSKCSGPVAAKAITEFFNKRMNAESRLKLADHFINAGNFLKAGQCGKAGQEFGHIIEEIDL